jgi:integrase
MAGDWPQRPPKALPIRDLKLRTETAGTRTTLRAGPKSAQVVTKLAPGIYTHGRDAYRFFARVRTKLHTHVFRPPHAMPLSELREAHQGWRSTLGGATTHPQRGTFAEDVDVYLARVSAMPSYRTRKTHLKAWVEALGGDQPRSAITADAIDAVLQGWLTEGYAPKTVALRRTDLIQVWSKLDGRRAPNPARATSVPPPPPPEPRAMLHGQVERAFAEIQDGKTKTRLWVLATTGLPHKQIKSLTRADIDIPGRQIRATPRRKGAGAAGGWRPIAPAAVDALTAFIDQRCFGAFNNSTLYRVWIRACKRAGLPGHWRPYDLRHSFGTWVYAATGDLASTADLLGHAKTETARRYTMGARMAVAKRATDLVQIPLGLGAKVVRRPGRAVSRKLHAPKN